VLSVTTYISHTAAKNQIVPEKRNYQVIFQRYGKKTFNKLTEAVMILLVGGNAR
jgi:hypothetical protein